jgi:hypothetical protein
MGFIKTFQTYRFSTFLAIGKDSSYFSVRFSVLVLKVDILDGCSDCNKPDDCFGCNISLLPKLDITTTIILSNTRIFEFVPPAFSILNGL